MFPPFIVRVVGWPGLKWFGLALAFLIAARSPVSVMLNRDTLPTNDISDSESPFSQARKRLPPGVRVGWILPSKVPGGLARAMVVAQYAMLPIRLTHLSAADCSVRGPTKCGAKDLDYLIIPDVPQENLLVAANQLGFLANLNDASALQMVPRAR